jgi:hypothetical protein
MTNEKPRIIFPKIIFGVPVEGAMERVLAGQPTPQPEPEASVPINNPNIVNSDYIKIPQIGKAISRLELPDYNNLNWQDTHFKLHDNGLYMPSPATFMQHFMNVLEAYKSKGKKTLFDAAGNPVSKKDLEDIYLHLTKDHIAVYGGQKGVWTWLDAMFKDGKILSEHRTAKDTNGNRILKSGKTENLEACLTEDCAADLEFNSQGLAIKKSKEQKYVQGKNLYFWHPRDGRVARFAAYSDRAYLACGRGPSGRVPVLGVFGVVNGGS